MPFERTAFFVSMKKKWLFLFLMLALPVLIYLFLQAFGDNRFDIPVYYENGIEQPLDGCMKGPDSTNFKIEHIRTDLEGIVVYGFAMGKGFTNDELNNIRVFLNRYNDVQGVTLSILTTDMMLISDLEESILQRQIVTKKGLLAYARCMLQVDLAYDMESANLAPRQFVLCDQQKRIRGYYNVDDLEEMDRLNTEIDILMNQYE